MRATLPQDSEIWVDSQILVLGPFASSASCDSARDSAFGSILRFSNSLFSFHFRRWVTWCFVISHEILAWRFSFSLGGTQFLGMLCSLALTSFLCICCSCMVVTWLVLALRDLG